MEEEANFEDERELVCFSFAGEKNIAFQQFAKDATSSPERKKESGLCTEREKERMVERKR